MIQIENNEACFVRLWLRLEHQRRLCELQYKRYCVRRVLKAWFGHEATDNFIWEVCLRCEQEGWNQLPPPTLYPGKHRELLKAIVEVRLHLGRNHIDLRALDRAYAIAFPQSAPLNAGRWHRRDMGKDDEEEASGDNFPEDKADNDTKADKDNDCYCDMIDFEP